MSIIKVYVPGRRHSKTIATFFTRCFGGATVTHGCTGYWEDLTKEILIEKVDIVESIVSELSERERTDLLTYMKGQREQTQQEVLLLVIDDRPYWIK